MSQIKDNQSVIRKAFDEMFTNPSEEDEDPGEEGFRPLPSDTIEVDRTSKVHECEEGMTELNGYFICKHCGTNLRKIK